MSRVSQESHKRVAKPPDPNGSAMSAEVEASTDGERDSLDLVQRTVVSFLVGGVIGMTAAVLALYVVTRGRYELPYDSTIGLWIMCGVIGLVGAVVVLILNRLKPYHPLVVLGLAPMVVAGYFLFG